VTAVPIDADVLEGRRHILFLRQEKFTKYVETAKNSFRRRYHLGNKDTTASRINQDVVLVDLVAGVRNLYRAVRHRNDIQLALVRTLFGRLAPTD
jgi:hypothetical protein